jgi:threonine aldolase
MNVIDLRSDTVTHPTPAMRRAMFEAEVGDDVYSEDPTVRRLERMAAGAMGKEAALFVASGTMGNLVAVLVQTQRGDRVVVGSEAHIYYYEGDGQRRLAGVELAPIPNDERGGMDPALVREALEAPGPPATLVCLENTHNRCGGAAHTAAETAAVADLARSHGARVHLDGARIFNAAVALGVPAAELAAPADSVTFCFSKGLSAPVGSILNGSADFINRARQMRRMVGGGMRQVGVIAAAGIVALETMVERLARDHENARLLAEGLATMPGIRLDAPSVQTNIVAFELEGWEPPDFLAALREAGVLAVPFGPHRIRMVTHNDVSREDVEKALERIRGVCAARV